MNVLKYQQEQVSGDLVLHEQDELFHPILVVEFKLIFLFTVGKKSFLCLL